MPGRDFTPEEERSRFERAEEIFGQALDAAPSERVALVAALCGDDLRLRARVLRLLEMDAEPDTRMLPSPAVWLEPDSLRPGVEIGRRYRLLEPLGDGGLGVVWRAEQFAPVARQVAIKFVRHELSGRHVAARFALERAALSLMDHPGICRIFDAGVTEDDRPYVVMELVTGDSITAACDRRRATIDDRIALFVETCRAVHHAHQKGILHRDLKPSNILVAEVDGRLVPKIIDFGIAKAMHVDLAPQLAADFTLTRAGQFIGTPAYMAPEQITGDTARIDVRTDIYALGVILHELLAGCLPFDTTRSTPPSPFAETPSAATHPARSPSASVRRLGDDDATRVSALRGETPRSLRLRLRGEVDWIVARAMAAEPDRRYASASELAADLDRFLANQPILAGPESVRYRLRKFVVRNTAAVVGGVALALVLMLGLVGTTIGMVRANAAQALERTAREDAELAREAALAASDRSARQSYRALIAAAEGAITLDDAGSAQTLLASTDPALRGWEWRHFSRLADQSDAVIRPGGGSVLGVALAPDETSLLVTSGDRSLSEWDLATGRLLRTATTDLDLPRRISISPRGDRVAVSGVSKDDLREDLRTLEFVLMSWPQGTIIRRGSGIVHESAFFPDGSRVVVGSGGPGEILLLDAASGSTAARWTVPTDEAVEAAVGEDADVVHFITRGSRRIGWLERSTDASTFHESASPLDRASLDIRAGILVGADPETGAAVMRRVWPRTSSRVWRVPAPRTGAILRDNCVAPNGRIAALGEHRSGSMEIHDLENRRSLGSIRGHSQRVASGCFSRDGRRLFTASEDGTVRIWTTPPTPVRWTVPATEPAKRVGAAIAPDGRVLASGGWSTVQLWATRTGELLWSRETGTRYVETVAFSPDGTWLAVAETDGRALLISVADGTIQRELPACAEGNTALAWDPLDRWILLAGADGVLRFIDVEESDVVREVPIFEGPIRSLAISPDGTHYAAGAGGTIYAGDSWGRLIDGASAPAAIALGRLDIPGDPSVRPEIVPWTSGVSSLRFDPRRGWLLVGDDSGAVTALRDGFSSDPEPRLEAVRRWTLAIAPTEVMPDDLRSPLRGVDVSALAVSSDGQRLAIGLRSGAVGVVDPESDGVLFRGEVEGRAHAIAFTDHDALVVGSTVPMTVFDGLPPEPEVAARRATVDAARRVADPLFSKLRIHADVLAAIEARLHTVASSPAAEDVEALREHDSLDDAVLEEARRFLLARGESITILISDAIYHARIPTAGEHAHRLSLRWAEHAARMRPDLAAPLQRVRALLLHRLGEHDAAAEALVLHRSGAKAEDTSMSLSVLATAVLIECARGNHAEARRNFDELRRRIDAGAPLDGDAPWLVPEATNAIRQSPE